MTDESCLLKLETGSVSDVITRRCGMQSCGYVGDECKEKRPTEPRSDDSLDEGEEGQETEHDCGVTIMAGVSVSDV
jgi:hypothetical protein